MIPYATLEDAAAALGRNLTWFETFWFNYSATKSDFYIYCHTILLLILVYTLVPLPLVFVELSRLFERYKFQPKVKYSFSDMFGCYTAVMKKFFFVVSLLQLSSYPTVQMIGIRSGLPLPSLMEVVAQLVVYILIEDYISYWIHRLLHCKWGYDNIHHIHHQYKAPIAYAAFHIHWAEIFLNGIPTSLGPAIAPGHILVYSFWLALRLIETIINHSGYDFSWNLMKYIPLYAGAEYHDYHHFVGGQSHCNLAFIFTYCDHIYGTDKGYRIHMKHRQQVNESKKIR